ncbi:hypothetical protein GOBAR_AA00878 [Gossypium barbadense]|uniref:Uncharacterized protein n=1 Tax=Gossypium barbadense TaxID=3634 RepID=A0A2P5YVR8_GOSBA|nr:hypothetical protein GOBAR_AA00878 [Gossypium barbadense]
MEYGCLAQSIQDLHGSIFYLIPMTSLQNKLSWPLNYMISTTDHHHHPRSNTRFWEKGFTFSSLENKLTTPCNAPQKPIVATNAQSTSAYETEIIRAYNVCVYIPSWQWGCDGPYCGLLLQRVDDISIR